VAVRWVLAAAARRYVGVRGTSTWSRTWRGCDSYVLVSVAGGGSEAIKPSWAERDRNAIAGRIVVNAFDQQGHQPVAFAERHVAPQRFQVVDRPKDRNPIGRRGIECSNLFGQCSYPNPIAIQLLVERCERFKSGGFSGRIGQGSRLRIDRSLGLSNLREKL